MTYDLFDQFASRTLFRSTLKLSSSEIIRFKIILCEVIVFFTLKIEKKDKFYMNYSSSFSKEIKDIKISTLKSRAIVDSRF